MFDENPNNRFFVEQNKLYFNHIGLHGLKSTLCNFEKDILINEVKKLIDINELHKDNSISISI